MSENTQTIISYANGLLTVIEGKAVDTEKLAETAIGTKAKPGLVTLNKDTIAYVAEVD